MKLAGARDAYSRASSSLSVVSRHLAFVGVAIVWIFREGDPPDHTLPAVLLCALLAFVVCLFLDLLHYAYKSLAWGWFHYVQERRFKSNLKSDFGATRPEEIEFEAPDWINYPALVFFWGKFLFCLIGYAGLGTYLVPVWVAS